MRSGHGSSGLQQRDVELTERQRQVLRLVASGKTNAEIGEALGISLDGAKWHVSEILARLDVATREEAAEWWRQRDTVSARIGRALAAMVPGAGWLKVGGALAAVVIVSTAVLVAIALNRSGGEGPNPTDSDRNVTAAANVTSSASAPAATTTAVPRITAPAGTPPTLREIHGLSTEAREVRSDIIRDVAPTTSDFPDWNRTSAVIYDIAHRTTIDLGPGSNVGWAPDSRRGVWVAYPAGQDQFGGAGRAMLIDVRDGSRQDLGPARFASFRNNDTVVIYPPGSNDAVAIDLRTGARTPTTATPDGKPTSLPYYLDINPDSRPIAPLRFGGNEQKTIELRETATDFVLYRFDAFAASMADAHSFVVATVPAGLQDLRSNLFLVDIASGEATYIATALASPDNWPFHASSRWITWTDGYCIYDESANAPAGKLRLFDRATGKVTEVRNPSAPLGHFAPWFDLTPNDLLQVGEFSGGRLLDPDTLKYSVSISGIHVNWTTDYAYAAQGQFGGHGGLCAG